ncbi:MAG: ABC-F family ATP-binding cassette domain-containing protein [Chloroflexi bacterium]|nr:ABC-F family ATP-binding cassette domain-containing protein [Chloroflexota bacterium]
MPILTAHNLSKSYGAQDIFDNVTLEVPHRAKIALVGPNGSGKSTLLRIIAGLETPSTGAVHRAKDLKIGYLPQQADFSGRGSLWDAMLEVFANLETQARDLRHMEGIMASGDGYDEDLLQRYGAALEAFELAGGYTYKHQVQRVLSGLGFERDEFDRPIAQFSGGEKTRALLAQRLLEEPDILLLDEPTNYLDIEGIEWLENYLKAWIGALVVVAHDRAFLDSVIDRVWELAWGHLVSYRGNYTAYSAQKTENAARQMAEFERQQEEISRTEDFIRRNIAGQLTRQAKGRQKRLDRIERIEAPRDYNPLHLSLGRVARSGDLVLGLYDLRVGYSAQEPLCKVEELQIWRGQRVALVGPNGSGKTTLVRTIMGELSPLSGQLRLGANVRQGYFAQGHADLNLEKTVLDTILDTANMPISQARSLLGSYRFSGDDVFKQVGMLSGGEQARVALAVLALQGANFLLLDEPTNHLDIPSQEVLQEVLTDFDGTLLIVTHDRYLISQIATVVWVIDRDTVRVFPEGYEAYRQWDQQRSERASAQDRALADDDARTDRETRRAAQREVTRQARLRTELEDRIHSLEARMAELERQLSVASTQQAVDHVTQLGLEYEAAEAELNETLAAWTALAE